MNWKRPLGLTPLLMVLATLVILSAMLASMVWSRVSLLQNGTQMVLKTAPIDPRDLLRGYYVRLSYDISRISLADLPLPMTKNELADGFEKHSTIYVKLQPDGDGFWSPLSLHRTLPKEAMKHADQNTAFIRGRIRYRSCTGKLRSVEKCKLSIRYGIEKFFAQKKRAKKLEDFGRQTSPEIKELQKNLKELQKSYSQLVRAKNRSREIPQNLPNQTQSDHQEKQMRTRLAEMRRNLGELRQQNRVEMAKRFAIIVRVDKHSGEAAISGLQLDGKQIYDEQLF